MLECMLNKRTHCSTLTLELAPHLRQSYKGDGLARLILIGSSSLNLLLQK
jgi:hypothetical protein